MSEKLNRELSVVIGELGKPRGLKIQKLRIVVNTTQTSDLKKNNGTIKIYNVNKSLTKELSSTSKKLGVTVYAGYNSTENPVFVGVVSGMYLDAEDTDLILNLKVVDGVLHANNAMFFKSFAGQVYVDDILLEICKAMQNRNSELQIARLPKNTYKKYKNGFTWAGTTGDCLTKICNDHKLTWFVNNNELYVVEPEQPLPALQVPLISSDTGLLGSPKYYENTTSTGKTKLKEKGISFTCKLNHEVKVGYEVRVESVSFTANYLIKKINLALDSTQGHFEMRCIGINEWE